MIATLFKKVDYSLDKLIQDIEFGHIGLPDIQRPFVWTPAKVRDLFDSMYKGFPVGYLLFWSNDHFSDARQIGTESKQAKVPRLLIVDGQQRLTALFAVLKGRTVIDKTYQPVHIKIAFRPRDSRFEVADAAIQRDPEFIPDISTLWTNGHASYKLVNAFLANLRESGREISAMDEKRIGDAIDRLYDLHNYPFTAMEIDSTVSEEQVADIFVRINSKGVQLRQADFILTLMSVFWDEGRMALETFSRQSRQPSIDGKPSPYNHFIQPEPDRMLRVSVAVGFKRARLEHVYSLLRGKDLETGEFSDEGRERQFAILQEAQLHALDIQNWHEFLKVLVKAGYRSSSMITSETSILYAYAMYLIGKHDYRIEKHTLRNLIARWYFMSALTGRYTGSPETVMEGDLARLRGATDPNGFIATLDQVIDSTLTSDFWEITLPSALETSSARSPSVFAYYAALNLLDACVLFSPMRVSELLDPALRARKSSLERHHLFPKGYLRASGYTDTRMINQAANFALVEWGDNISISDTPPAEYFPAYSARFSAGELAKMMWWHALPNGWHEMDYDTFLVERRRLMAEVTKEGFQVLRKAKAAI